MPGAESHYVHRTAWLRAAVLGANDGIISTASLIMSVAVRREYWSLRASARHVGHCVGHKSERSPDGGVVRPLRRNGRSISVGIPRSAQRGFAEIVTHRRLRPVLWEDGQS
jgi:hypothetical protein